MVPVLTWAAIFAVLATVCALIGFTGVATGAATLAKVLFVLLLVLFAAMIALIMLGIGVDREP